MPASTEKSGLGPGAILIAMLATVGIATPLLRPAPPQTAVTSSPTTFQAARSQRKLKTHSAEEMVLEYLDAADDELDSKQPWSRTPYRPKNGIPADPPFIQFLIATLPTPNSAPERYKFDTYLDAINEAANTSGYDLDSFDLPWVDSAQTKPETFKLGQQIDLASAENLTGQNINSPPAVNLTLKPNTEDDDRRRGDPGLILFRKREPAANSLLMLFAVEETPTAGVNRAQLRSALDQIAWLSGWNSDQPVEHRPRVLINNSTKSGAAGVKLLGPTFSGSATSLVTTLQTWLDSFNVQTKTDPVGDAGSKDHIRKRQCRKERCKTNGVRHAALNVDPPHITMVSGTATSAEVKLGQLGPKRADFHTTIIPDKILWPCIVDDLLNDRANTGLGPCRVDPKKYPRPTPPTIALLTEDTTFGSSIAKVTEDTTFGSTIVGTPAPPTILSMPFPLHISALRNAFSKAQLSEVQPGLQLSTRNLPFVDETGPDQDVVPSFSARSPIYDELVLSNLLTTIHREHIPYVGIVATDVEDLLFLAREVRNFSPDTVIFTTMADLRYLHSGVNPDLDGVLVFSTYPLFRMNQRITFPFGRAGSPNQPVVPRIQFPSELAEGVYNAALKLLDDEREPLHPLPMLEYGEPLTDHIAKPVIWLGVVGQNAIWPVSFQRFDLYAPGAKAPDVLADNALVKRSGGVDESVISLTSMYPNTIFVPYFLFLLFSLVVAIVSFLTAIDTPISKRGPCRLMLRRMPLWFRIFDHQSIPREMAVEQSSFLTMFLVGLLAVTFVGQEFVHLPLTAEGLLSASKLKIGLPPVATWLTWIANATMTSLSVAAFASFVMMFSARLHAGDQESAAAQSGAGFGDAIIGFGIGFTVLAGFGGWAWLRAFETNNPAVAVLTFVRSFDMWGGVSPLHPLVFAAAGILSLFAFKLRLLGVLDECRVKPYFLGFRTPSFTGVRELEKGVVDLLECSFVELPGWWLPFSLVIGFACVLYFRIWWVPSIDGSTFDHSFLAIFVLAHLMFVVPLLRFAEVWWALRHLLRRLYWHPTRRSYERLRINSLSDRPQDQFIRLYEPRPSFGAVEFCLQCARGILRLAIRGESTTSSTLAQPWLWPLVDRLRNARFSLARLIRDVEDTVQVLQGLGPFQWREARETRLLLQRQMFDLTDRLTELFEPVWRLSAHLSASQFRHSDDGLIEQANLFVAGRVLDFLRQIFPQLQLMVTFAIAGMVIMMLSVSQHPFQPRDTLLLFGWAVLLSAVAITSIVFFQINRERILSMLSGNHPGRVSWDSALVLQLLVFGVLPILALLGAQYPHWLGGIFSWTGGVLGGGRQ